ncbi:MAG: hypothetical protein KY437_01555, partial [Actinobacteria bacterium]|nr:hypothetical protein [Actinomycetota bacterium]
VAIGGRTGRDGLRGATFSSMEMDAATSEVAGSAVQIGDPIQEKRVLEVVLPVEPDSTGDVAGVVEAGVLVDIGEHHPVGLEVLLGPVGRDERIGVGRHGGLLAGGRMTYDEDAVVPFLPPTHT